MPPAATTRTADILKKFFTVLFIAALLLNGLATFSPAQAKTDLPAPAAIDTIAVAASSTATTLATDNFSYTDGPLVGNGGWVSQDGTAGTLLVSGGEAVVTQDSGSEDGELKFADDLTTGVLTATFDIRVTAPGTMTGTDFEYFAHFSNDTELNFRSRVDVVTPNGASDYTLGLSADDSSHDVALPVDFAFGATVAVSVSFDLNTGTASLTAGGQTVSDSYSFSGETLDSFNLRQSSSSSDETIYVDNLVVTHDPPPTVQSLDPADDATGIAVDTNLVITFTETVITDTGVITIHLSSDDSVIETIDVVSPTVAVTGSVATINPSTFLDFDTEYYINIEAGAFEDTIGNDFAGIADTTSWNFTTSADRLIISEIVDATLPSGLPKFVELTNVGSVTIDLSDYSIGNYNNGGTTLGGSASTVLSGSLVPGDSYVISYETGDSPGVGTFHDTYGFDPDNFDLGAWINGDDVVALFFGPATGDGSDAPIVDVYGVIGTDGTGEVWEYTDGYAYRNPGAGPNTTFTPAEWTFGGANSLETGDDVTELALIQSQTTPGTHNNDATGPTIQELDPPDDATDIEVDTNLVITFSETVVTDTGVITIHLASDDSVIETIDVVSPTVAVTGSVATINPVANLDYETGYYINIDAGAFEDSAGNDFAGIADATTWNFTTNAPPQINEFRPNPNGVDPTTNEFVELKGTPGTAFSGVLVFIESDPGNPGDINEYYSVSGTFDANGLLIFDTGDVENPAFTLALMDTFTGSTSTDIDTDDDGTPDDLSTFGTVFDAVGVPDDSTNDILLYGADLGGTDFNYTGDEPRLVFRDGTTGDLYAVNDPDNGEVLDVTAAVLDPADFDSDPTAADTFGAVNPSYTPPAGPTIQDLNPADDATGIAIDTNLVITFSETVVTDTGVITIHLASDDSVVETIDVTSPTVSVSGTVATMDPVGDLTAATEYYINIAAGAFENTSGVDFAGIADTTTWNFTTFNPDAPAGTLLTWWSFNNSNNDSDLLNATGDDNARANYGHMLDNNDSYDDGFYDPAAAVSGVNPQAPGEDRLYPVSDSSSGTPGTLVYTTDPGVGVPDISDYGAYIDVTSLTGDNAETGTSDNWGSFSGTGTNRPYGSYGGGSLSIIGSGNNGKYIEVMANLTGYDNIEISWAQYGTSTGFNSRIVSVSTDGVSYTNIYTDTGALTSSWAVVSVDAGDLLDNAATAYIRITLDGASSTSGNNRIDNIVLKGDYVPLVNEFQPNADGADPDPASVELIGEPNADFDLWLLSVENDGYDGVVERGTNVTGTFDASGYITVAIGDLENPSFTVILTDDFTGVVGSTDIDPANNGTLDLSTLGEIHDAVGVSDASSDDASMYGVLLGGVDILFNGQFDPLLAFRDGKSRAWYNTVTVDYGQVTEHVGVFDASGSGTELNGSDFDNDPTVSKTFDTFGAVNPIYTVDTAAPAIQALEPADDATGVALGADLVITFTESVITGTGYITIHLGADNSVVEAVPVSSPSVTVSGAAVTVDPTASFIVSTDYYIRIDAGAVVDLDGNPFAGIADATTWNFDTDTILTVPIYEIQGSGAASPYDGDTVTTSGIVVGDFQDADELSGFFLQDPVGDADVTTSDGIFIYVPEANATWYGFAVAAGDVVSVTGNVKEYNTFTQMDYITDISIASTGNPLPAPAAVTLPETTDGELEQYEGMYVQFTSLTVTQNYFLGRYGQMTLSGSGRLYQPTNQHAPGSAAAADLADLNARSLLFLDDGSSSQNPDPVPYLGGPPPAVIRAGDTIASLTGLLDYGAINSSSDRDYRIHPAVAPAFTAQNPRTAAPDSVGGTLTVASFNVLNYFNGDGLGGGFPTSRGADTAEEFTRQRTKIISALLAIDADVVGLMEIENDGYGATSAIADLVDGLNDQAGGGTYAFIDPGLAQLGTDEIAVGLIYKPAAVTPINSAAVLSDTAFTDPYSTGTPKNRVALAQTFDQNANGERFSVVVNHLKSKGSDCGGAPDDDPEQGNCNGTRTQAAIYQRDWIATDPTLSGDPDYIVLGDLNAYAMEDPIMAFVDNGYTNLTKEFAGDTAYSYIFDGLSGYLDHALANTTFLPQVTDVTVWHINADEPSVIDYDQNWNPDGYYAPDSYRASDHDPVIIGLDLQAEVTGTLDTIVPGTTYSLPNNICGSITFTTTGTVDRVEITYSQTFPSINGDGLPRTYVITAYDSLGNEVTTGFEARLTLCYADIDLTLAGIDSSQEPNLHLYRYVGGGSWQQYSIVDAANNTVTGENVLNFSTWGIGIEGDSPTRLTLTSFAGTPADHRHLIALAALSLLGLSLFIATRFLFKKRKA